MSLAYPAAELDPTSRHIRLANISPGQHTDEVACELIEASLDDLPSYYSLSYAWGNPKDLHDILLNGRPYKVTRNLKAALRRLRLADQSRLFWIDMICIDQDNVTERTHQVNLMQKIYSGAQEVFLWLGDILDSKDHEASTVDHSENCRETISRKDFGLAFGLIRDLSDKQRSEAVFEQLRQDQSSPQLLAELYALNIFMTFSWWQRIWVVQEAILPRELTVLVGNLHIPWTDLAKAMRNYESFIESEAISDTYYNLLNRFYTCIDGIEDYRAKYQQGDYLKLPSLLERYQQRVSSDARDKVFALLGLVANNPKYHLLKADYTLAPEKVYKDTFLHLLSRFGLRTLVRTKELSRNLDLPTWVTDWTAEVDKDNTFVHIAYRRYVEIYNASQTPSWQCDWSESNNILKIRGLEVDEVSGLAHLPSDLGGSIEHYLTYLRTFVDAIPYQSRSYTGGLSRDYAFWRLILLGIAGFHTDTTLEHSKKADYQDYENWLARASYQSSLWRLVQRVSDWPNFRPFITKSGHVGLGPDTMRVGDTLHIFIGATVPFVLRKAASPANSSTDETRYEYIGSCYIQGLMDGEAMEGVVISELGYIHII